MKKSILLVLFLVCLFSSAFVLADHIVTLNSGGNTIQMDVNVSGGFNFKVNNTEYGDSAGIGRVEAFLQTGLRFVENSASSSISGTTITNTSESVIWTASPLLNGTNGSVIGEFSFSINASSFGNLEVRINTTNSSGSYQNIFYVNVTDRVKPSVSVSSAPIEGINTTNSSFFVSAISSDNSNIILMNITLYNSNWNPVNSTSAQASQISYNFSFPSEGTYYYNITAIDRYSNIGNAALRTIKYDRTSPSLSLSRNSRTEEELGISISADEILYDCSTDRGSVTKNNNNYYINSSGLSCETYYWFNVSCRDYTGNRGYVTGNFSTDDCNSENPATITNEIQTDYWNNTYSYDSKDLEQQPKLERELRERDRIKIKISNETHYVGVIEITSVSAKINVSSKPQQAIFANGDSKKFDLNDDRKYDLQISLNSIKDKKANLTLSYISEEISSAEQLSTGNLENKESLQEKNGVVANMSPATWIIIGAIFVGLMLGGTYLFKKYKEFKIRNGEMKA